MQFTDIIFAFFLLIVFTLYWFPLREKTSCQNILLLVASYIFYGWWDWRFLCLIFATSLATFVTSNCCQGKHRKLITTINIVFNLSILLVFKYFNFFSENLKALFDLFGMGLDWFTIDVLLPVGISFYTFQAIGYSVDVYKGRIEPCRNLIVFLTFIAYFPQLVAGPIERASQLLPQLQNKRIWDRAQATSGLRLLLFGLVKKLCVADMIAIYVERIFHSGHEISPLGVLVGGILFTVEIYCDFSAYSEMARGVSQLLGIELMVNFRFPLFSRNVIEFWQRWHISLMEWFRDYLYIPLGGNRCGRYRRVLNLFIVFMLSGLWHGAAWNFILWGFYWGVIYIICKVVLQQRKITRDMEVRDVPNMILTFGVVALSFYLFRCSSYAEILSGLTECWVYIPFFGLIWLFAKALIRLKWMFKLVYILSLIGIVGVFILSFSHWWLWLKVWWLLPAMVVAVSEWIGRNGDFPWQDMPHKEWQRIVVYAICVFCVIISEPTEMQFIYFQF